MLRYSIVQPLFVEYICVTEHKGFPFQENNVGIWFDYVGKYAFGISLWAMKIIKKINLG